MSAFLNSFVLFVAIFVMPIWIAEKHIEDCRKRGFTEFSVSLLRNNPIRFQCKEWGKK
jgi:hypothetical protein